MDVLKDKNYKDYDYVCRYSSVPYYYNTLDNKYIYGLGTQIQKNIAYVAHKVTATDNLDSLALKYYGNPTYYWIIAMFNNINDAYENLIDYYDILKIPNIMSISFGDER